LKSADKSAHTKSNAKHVNKFLYCGRALLQRDALVGGQRDFNTCSSRNAQNFVKACPMNIPLTRAIYEENRETVLYGLFGWLKK